MDTLIKLGEWSIMRLNNSKAWAQHSCMSFDSPYGEYSYSWVTSDTGAVCLHCDTPVPDEVQTLIALLM